MDQKVISVGITGGIGSGKSLVCKIFASMGVPVLDADQLAKDLIHTDPTLKKAIQEAFGNESYKLNGEYDRGFVASKVFKDPAALKLLNDIVHPVVIEAGRQWFVRQKTTYAIKEAALLIESKSHVLNDLVILVESPMALRIKRVKARDQISEEQILQRIQNQMSDEAKRPFANFIIQNDEEHSLIVQILNIHQQILSHAAR